MTKSAQIFAKLTFATAIHYSVNLRVFRWASCVNCLGKIFPGDVQMLEFPIEIAGQIVEAVDGAIGRACDPVALTDIEIEAIIVAGYNAGVKAVSEYCGL